jgi:acyl transferase domain-containing protein
MDSANGFVASEGAAAIVLQKSCDAGGMAYGAVRATCVGQNGTSRGFFAPNPKAQRRLLETALERANCLADDVSFLEGMCI